MTPFDDEERGKRKQAGAKREKLEALDLLFVMNDEAGRRFVHRMLTAAGVWRSSFAPGDPHQTAFNEGNRNSGLRLLGQVMEIAPAQYTLMLEEARNADPQ